MGSHFFVLIPTIKYYTVFKIQSTLQYKYIYVYYSYLCTITALFY